MPKELIVGMYNADGTHHCPSDDYRMRLQELRIAMTHTFSQALPAPYPAPPLPVPGQPPPPPPPPPAPTLRIFLATEYFFRKNWARSQAAGTTTAYTEQEWIDIQNELLRYSTAYPNFLLIGGTVFWIPRHRGRLIKKTLRIERAPIRHSMVVAHNGNLLLTYDKKNDCNELQGFERDRYYRYEVGAAAGTFPCDGLQCGVETCADHSANQLGQDGANNLDLQIVISNVTTVDAPKVHVRNGGFVLHCNAAQNPGQHLGNDVFHHPFAWNSKVPYRSQVNTNTGQCTLFRLILN